MEDVHSQMKTTAKRSEMPLDRRNMTFIQTHLAGPEGGGMGISINLWTSIITNVNSNATPGTSSSSSIETEPTSSFAVLALKALQLQPTSSSETHTRILASQSSHRNHHLC